MKQALIYSLKVWLTTVVLGMRIAALIKILLDTDHLIYKFSDIFTSAVYDIPVGLIACLPSFGIFLLTVSLLRKSNYNIRSKKLVLSALGLLLSVLPFALLFTHQLFNINYLPDMLPELCAYTGLTIAGIWFYKLETLTTIKQ
jgi:hypothetical protein